jgi:hypothetical protein
MAPLTARATAIGSRNSMSGPGLELRAVSGVVRPKSPIRTPASVSLTSGRASPNGRPERRSRTLADSQVKADSRMRSASTRGPKSNS